MPTENSPIGKLCNVVVVVSGGEGRILGRVAPTTTTTLPGFRPTRARARV